MAIIIQNMGGDMDGECEYRLSINNQTIAYFNHYRPDGLEKCLIKAAAAAKKAHKDETAMLMEMFLREH